MKTVKIFTVIASILLIALIALSTTVQEPLEKQYQQALNTLMQQQGYASESEALHFLPELAEVKRQITQAKKWKGDIRRMQSSPQSSSGAESRELIRRMKTTQQLRRAIQQQLIATAKNSETAGL